MPTLTDHVIDSVVAHHAQLAALVDGLSDDDLGSRSGAAEWTVADVLSHLGSGAEIYLPRVAAGLQGRPVSEVDSQSVWDRWNALSPREQAEAFVEHDARLVDVIEGATDEQRALAQIDLGFLPAPVPVSVAAGMRLNEVANHAWDVRAGLDPEAGLDAEAATLLLDLIAGELGFLLGFSTRPTELSEPANVVVGDHLLVVDDEVRVMAGPAGIAPTATFVGPTEAFVRLLSGRLGPDRTPEGAHVTGNVSLDDLRRVFPGY